jgi:alpha-tubulin suppressor-like RCC1 family protein
MTITNLLVIDRSVQDFQVFVNSVNSNTLPVLYLSIKTIYNFLQESITNGDTYERVGFVFINGIGSIGGTLAKEGSFNAPIEFSDFRNLLINFIKMCNVKNIDFFASNTLNIPIWNDYYTGLTNLTRVFDGNNYSSGVTVAASNNLTGNINYGGDWILQYNSGVYVDIKPIYFNENIENYKYILDTDFKGTHNFIITNENKLLGSGSNAYGQILLNSSLKTLQFTEIKKYIKKVVTSGEHTLLLTTGGELLVCGRNDFGQLGLPENRSRLDFENVFEYTKVKSIAVGKNHSLLLTNEGEVWGCGKNLNGQLGKREVQSLNEFTLIKTNIKEIACGGNHSLFLSTTDELWACGDNTYGQLGITESNDGDIYKILTDVKKIAAGTNHTMVLKNNNEAWACGDNTNRQLGIINNYTMISVFNFEKVEESVDSISCNDDTSFIIKGGEVWTTGVIVLFFRLNPKIFYGLFKLSISDVKEVSGSIDHYLFLKTNGDVYGFGDYRSIGNYEEDSRIIANDINDINNINNSVKPIFIDSNIESIAVGYACSFLLKSDGSLGLCGYYNNYGQLGYTLHQKIDTFTRVTELNIKTFASGHRHSVILTTTGDAYTSGDNTYGQLGIGYYDNNAANNYTKIMSNVISVACGFNKTILLLNTGKIWTSGETLESKLADPNDASHFFTEETYNNSSISAMAVSAGYRHMLVLLKNGNVISRGENTYGQLGIVSSRPTYKSDYTVVFGSASYVACGFNHSFVITKDNKLSVCGNNLYGQLGLTGTENRYEYEYVTDNVYSAVGGYSHSVILKTNGEVWVSGDNSYGQLGLDPTDTRLTNNRTNTFILLTSDVKSISCNYFNTIILKNNGDLWVSGDNSYGQLGIQNKSKCFILEKIMENIKTINYSPPGVFTITPNEGNTNTIVTINGMNMQSISSILIHYTINSTAPNTVPDVYIPLSLVSKTNNIITFRVPTTNVNSFDLIFKDEYNKDIIVPYTFTYKNPEIRSIFFLDVANRDPGGIYGLNLELVKGIKIENSYATNLVLTKAPSIYSEINDLLSFNYPDATNGPHTIVIEDTGGNICPVNPEYRLIYYKNIVVDSISPLYGIKGTTLTIRGNNLSKVTSIILNDNNLLNANYTKTDTKITCLVREGTGKNNEIKLLNVNTIIPLPEGNTFTYTYAEFKDLLPLRGNNGTICSLYGIYLNNVTIRVNNKIIEPLTISEQTMTFMVPIGIGTVPIVVSDNITTKTYNFTYTTEPIITDPTNPILSDEYKKGIYFQSSKEDYTKNKLTIEFTVTNIIGTVEFVYSFWDDEEFTNLVNESAYFPITNNGVYTYELDVDSELFFSGHFSLLSGSSLTMSSYRIDGIEEIINGDITFTLPSNPDPPEPSNVQKSRKLMSTMSFPTGSYVKTDQGQVEIQQINPAVHTILGKRVVSITETFSINKRKCKVYLLMSG